ncbi:MAG: glycosyltransferase family 9 protein [Nitrospinota bacterium]|nr:glycosyltransferase family 9 protein [Nitrospinota bacterium]
METSATPKTKPQKILLIKLGAVGDLVFASAFFDSVRKHFNHAQVVLLTGKTSVRTVENNPSLDRLLLADDAALYKGSLFFRCRETLRIIKLLRSESFDLAFVLHRSWIFNLLAFLCGIPQRVGFRRGREGILLTHKVDLQPNRNERESYLDILRELGTAAKYERSFYYLSRAEDEFLSSFLHNHKIREEENLIGIAPGGGKNVKTHMANKRWPEKNYIGLIEKIREAIPCRIILFGGRDDGEIASRIRKEHPACLDATDLSFGEMASVFRRCQLLISNDSGPLHIASAMDIPTLSFYGPTNPAELAPLGPEDTTIYKKVECSPCYNQGRFPECDHLKCLTSITVDEAWTQVSMKLRPISKKA